MTLIRRHLLISGRVQGVCFRYYTRKTALSNGVTGWVRNLPDGRVEAEVEGEKIAVERTIVWCQSGPEMAQVDHIEVEEREVRGEGQDFTIR
jgi:acylphosphatase